MLIKVKVIPNAKKDEVIKKSVDSFEVKTVTKPERGEANEKVKSLLANFLKTSETAIRLIKGHRQRNKIFEIKSPL